MKAHAKCKLNYANSKTKAFKRKSNPLFFYSPRSWLMHLVLLDFCKHKCNKRLWWMEERIIRLKLNLEIECAFWWEERAYIDVLTIDWSCGRDVGLKNAMEKLTIIPYSLIKCNWLKYARKIGGFMIGWNYRNLN